MAYVYIHRKKTDNNIFYIGVGSDKKYKRANLFSGRNSIWNRIFKKYGALVEITHDNLIWEEACSIEKYLISFYGRLNNKTGCLSNLTDGGEGCYGRIVSDETRQKHKKSATGKIFTEEHKQKLRKPKNFSKEIIKNLSIRIKKIQPIAVIASLKKEAIEKRIKKIKGRKASESTKQKMSLARKGKTFSNSHKKNISNSLKGKKKDPSIGLLHSIKMKGRYVGANNFNSKKVINVLTNEIFGTISDAAKSINIHPVTLSKKINKDPNFIFKFKK